MELLSVKSRLELRLAAAKLELGLIQSWEFPQIADRALSNGDYSPALAELAALSEPIMSDVKPLFMQALAESGQQITSKPESAWLIAHHCAEAIVSDGQSLRAALALLNEASIAVGDVLPYKKCVGDNLDAESLIGLYWSYTEPNENCYQGRVISDETERLAILDSHARNEAKEWLARHPEIRSSS